VRAGLGASLSHLEAFPHHVRDRSAPGRCFGWHGFRIFTSFGFSEILIFSGARAMKDTEGRWARRRSALEADPVREVVEPSKAGHAASGPSPTARVESASDLRRRIHSTALAFRGFDVENAGRGLEFLEHPRYGPTVARFLDEAGTLCAEAIHRPVDLRAHLRSGPRLALEAFPEDVALIVALELAQLSILEECFDVPTHQARLSFGYSIGELGALVHSGVFTLEQLLPIPLALAPDCAELASDLTMGVLFTKGPYLAMDEVERLCRAISSEGKGLIGPSAFLSPNTALILGQGNTIARLDEVKGELASSRGNKVMLRRNANRWPPLHSPLVWRRHIPNRAAVALYQTEGGTRRPSPIILSCVTGDAPYDGHRSREVLTDWTDHPQRLWDVIDRTLAMGAEVVVHVGPRPNLIPATFSRLSTNVLRHQGNRTLRMLGRGVVSGLNHGAWLARMLPSSATLLRAPYLSHVILEDWLLAQPLPPTSVGFAGVGVTKEKP
jgi:[acyl-carrier-protein] S-malonyltransferase